MAAKAAPTRQLQTSGAGEADTSLPLPKHRKSFTFAGLLAPSIGLLCLLNIYPLGFAVDQALHNGTLLSSGQFVGLQNFTTVLDSGQFWSAAWVTLLFAVASVIASWLVGLVLALIFKAGVPFATPLRIVFMLPWILPVVVSAAVWQWLVSVPTSPVLDLTRGLGLGNVPFLANPTLALITLIIFRTWIAFPFMFLTSAAALESVEPEFYEAASTDGAGGIRQFTHVTWPLIRKPAYVSLLLMTIFTVNDFGSVYLLTGGGPVNATTTLPVLSYLLVFREFVSGQGVAVSILMSIVLVIVSVFLYRQIRRSDRD